MSSTIETSFETSRVHRLAKKLEEDIQSRGLTTGDRYLTATQAANEFDVSISTAHRALKMLADSEVLLRRRNHGTFVGSQGDKGSKCVVETIQYLEPAEIDTRDDNYSCWIHSLRQHFPHASVQFNCVPTENAVDYAAELIRSAKTSGKLLGIVANSCPQIYSFLGNSGIPTVVSGSLRHGDPLLPSLDIDNHESGRLLALHLAERGHRRIAVFGHDSNDRPGTHELLDGVVEGITEAGLPANSLMVRFFSYNFDSFSTAAKAALKTENRPTAAITYGIPRARRISQAARELGLSVPDDFEVVFCGEPANGDDIGQYTRAVSDMSDEERVMTVAKMLKDLTDSSFPEKSHVVIPVKLIEARRN